MSDPTTWPVPPNPRGVTVAQVDRLLTIYQPWTRAGAHKSLTRQCAQRVVDRLLEVRRLLVEQEPA